MQSNFYNYKAKNAMMLISNAKNNKFVSFSCETKLFYAKLMDMLRLLFIKTRKSLRRA